MPAAAVCHHTVRKDEHLIDVERLELLTIAMHQAKLDDVTAVATLVLGRHRMDDRGRPRSDLAVPGDEPAVDPDRGAGDELRGCWPLPRRDDELAEMDTGRQRPALRPDQAASRDARRARDGHELAGVERAGSAAEIAQADVPENLSWL